MPTTATDEAQETFEGELATAKQEAKVTFKTELAKAEETARTQFERQAGARRVHFKREHLRAYGRYPTPRAVTEYSSKERKSFETQLAEWNASQTRQFETGISSWEQKQRSRLMETPTITADQMRQFGKMMLQKRHEEKFAITHALIKKDPLPPKLNGQPIVSMKQWGKMLKQIHQQEKKAELHAMVQQKAEIFGWKSDILERYPEPKYNVTFIQTPEGIQANIQELLPEKKRFPVASLAYRQAVEGKIPMTPEILEKEIQRIYSKAPIKRIKVREGKRFVFKEYFKPTPEQTEQIFELAKQLPPEKQAKYIVEVLSPKEEPKGIAETLVSIKMEDVQKFFAVGLADVAGLKGEKREKFLKSHEQLSYSLQPRLVTGETMPMFGEPVQAVGALASGPESLIYGGERLISTFITPHEPVTPRPPPTTTSGIIGTVLGDPSELAKVQEYGSSYMMGSLMGDILLGYATGKILEKPVGWVGSKAWAGAKQIPVIQKIPKTAEKLATRASYQFRQHAPYWLQREVYGKELARQLQIEKQWGWQTTKTGTTGLMEETFGMPFYAHQTLLYSVPTKEWARIHAIELLASQMRMERQLAWTVGLYPAYGVLPSEVAKPLTLAQKLEQAERVPTYDLEKTFRMKMVEGQLKPEIVTTGAVPTGKKTAFTYRAAFEFEQSVKMAMPTRFFVPTVKTTDFFMVTRGFPTTPFEKTLGRAIGEPLFGGLIGGIPTAQLLWRATITPPSPQTFFTAPIKRYPAVEFERLFYFAPTKAIAQQEMSSILYGLGFSAFMKTQVPTLKQPSRLKTRLVPSVAQVPTVEEMLEPMSTQIVSPIQVVAQVTQQQQVQRQTQTQLQRLFTPTPTAPSAPSIFTPPWTPPRKDFAYKPPPWLMPTYPRRRKKKKRGRPLDLYGRYPRFYPVATAKEFLEMMI